MALPDLQGAMWAWVQALPPWQSDLLRRLAVLDVVEERDLAEAREMVLGAFGAAENGSPAPEPVPTLRSTARHSQPLRNCWRCAISWLWDQHRPGSACNSRQRG